jgi:hypothetical protein
MAPQLTKKLGKKIFELIYKFPHLYFWGLFLIIAGSAIIAKYINQQAYWFTKPLVVSHCLVYIYLFRQKIVRLKSWQLFVAALSASLAGDITLMFPSVAFLGFVFFLLAHIFYILFFMRPLNKKKLALYFIIFGTSFASTLGLIYLIALPAFFAGLLLAYSALLTAMVIAAYNYEAPKYGWISGAACAFWLSDAILLSYHALQKNNWMPFVFLSSYFGAQGAFTWGIFLKSRKL